jgi:hypothetical protein
VVEHYSIELSDVYESITYYYDNKAEMDTANEKAEALLKEVGVNHEDLKAKVLKCMADKEAENEKSTE